MDGDGWRFSRPQPTAPDNGSGFEVRISVLMPCHNEARHVQRSLWETVRTLRESDVPFEILLVDDGSTDDTWRLAQAIASATPEVRLARVPVNGGKGHALREAFKDSNGPVICFLDGDLDIHPKHIIPFLHALENDSAQIVIGSKRHPDSNIDYPLQRRVLSKAYELLVRALFRLKVRDTQAGIKVFRRDALERVISLGLVKRYAFDAELLALAHRLGYRIAEAPIEMRFREKYGSGVDLHAVMEMLYDTLGVFFRLYVTKYYDRANPERGPGAQAE